MENNKRTSFDTVSKGKIHLLDKGLHIGTDIDPTVIVGRRIAVFRKFGKEQFILCRGTTDLLIFKRFFYFFFETFLRFVLLAIQILIQ